MCEIFSGRELELRKSPAVGSPGTFIREVRIRKKRLQAPLMFCRSETKSEKPHQKGQVLLDPRIQTLRIAPILEAAGHE